MMTFWPSLKTIMTKSPRNKNIDLVCDNCKKNFHPFTTAIKTAKFCSSKCYHEKHVKIPSKIYYKNYYKKNKLRLKENSKRYELRNIDRVKASRHATYLKYKDKKLEYGRQRYQRLKERYKQYRIDNKLRIKNTNHNYHYKNREKILKQQKVYYGKNREHLNDYYRNHKDVIKKQLNEKYKNDINFKLQKGLRNSLNQILKRGSQRKIGSAVKYLGCSISELKKYLESQFDGTMTWDNHRLRGWHIDHIVPLSIFNLEDIEQLKVACHYTNLQPMWWRENIIKYNKLPTNQK